MQALQFRPLQIALGFNFFNLAQLFFACSLLDESGKPKLLE
jgi:hypothetical protein